ncbi:CRISPR-associated protein Cas4 [Desulfonauticus submarinus]
MKQITGNLINAYYICHRKLWLFAHEVNPPSNNPYLEIGTLIGEESYKREKREILVGNIKIDLIKKESGNTVIAEIKKSSKGIKAARMQLLFYLYQLKRKGIKAKGELLIPKERKKISMELTAESIEILEKTITEIEEIISKEKPPLPKKISFCRNCSYFEFCWS